MDRQRVEFYRGVVGGHAPMGIAFSSIQKGTRPFNIYNSWFGKLGFMKLAKQGIANPYLVIPYSEGYQAFQKL